MPAVLVYTAENWLSAKRKNWIELKFNWKKRAPEESFLARAFFIKTHDFPF